MSGKLVINGGKPLKGEVYISGGKNPAAAVVPAVILCEEPCVIENLPDIEDMKVFEELLTSLGAKVKYANNTLEIDPSTINNWHAPEHLVSRMRASNYLLGTLLGRFGHAEVAFPGGCAIGARPMDLHLKGLRAMGAKIELKRGIFECSCEGGLVGAEIYMDSVSVGATINIMLAATKAKGVTTIVNAAKEPHVVDLANFLSAMGASIKGAGTDTIRITGQKKLHGCRYSILPDQIETGTWMMIAAATKGDITIRDCVPYHLESVSAKLLEMGVEVIEGEDFLRVRGVEKMKAVQIKTLPYPGFPTDLQQPISVLLCVADGTSVVIENIFESRFKHMNELRRMGANVRAEDRIAVIEGVDGLWGAHVSAMDLRAGAALVVAGLMADGTTTIDNIKHIDRGYEHIVDKLKVLGADIKRIDE